MGWREWVRHTVETVGEVIETGRRGIIELAEEIRPIIFPRPADVEAIEEIIEELATTESFIREAIPPEAVRLARGVRRRERLTNVARVREWTAVTAEYVKPSKDYYISVRRVLVGPDGTMTHVDVRFPLNEAYTEDEMIKRAASALDDDFVSQYDMGRSALVRQYTLTQEVYLETFPKL